VSDLFKMAKTKIMSDYKQEMIEAKLKASKRMRQRLEAAEKVFGKPERQVRSKEKEKEGREMVWGRKGDLENAIVEVVKSYKFGHRFKTSDVWKAVKEEKPATSLTSVAARFSEFMRGKSKDSEIGKYLRKVLAEKREGKAFIYEKLEDEK
jgi:hypothetical protein